MINFLKRKHIFCYALMPFLAIGMASCHDFVFESEGDCEVTYSIRFAYDMNLKWADAFISEVKSVNLYVFDSNGIFVREYSGEGEALSIPDYKIDLDLPGGETYKFLAWCGLENPQFNYEAFSVTQPEAGVTTLEEMECMLRTQSVTGTETEYIDWQLPFLFYGFLEQELPDTQDGKDYVYTIFLTKDTNHVRVMLQQVGGSLSPEDFDISLTADNGLLAWNNLPMGLTPVNFVPWNLESDILGVGNTAGETIEYTGVVADLSTSRLMSDRINDIFLKVRKKDTGELLFKVPVIQYSLSVKNYYEQAYGHKMTDQEFLDRQDEYFMTFFLGENLDWLYLEINVLEWRIVVHNYSNEN